MNGSPFVVRTRSITEATSVSRLTLSNRMRTSLAGAAIALLAQMLVAPGSARAGCVDPLMNGRSSSDYFVMLRSFGAIEDSPSVGSHSPDRSNKTLPDCFGPSCSRRDELPASQTHSGSPRVSEWAVLESQVPEVRPQQCRRIDHELAARPIRAASKIFHPPRLTPLAV